MALFVEKRKDGSSLRIFPLAVIEGEILGMTIQVKAPPEFREFYPFVLAGFFQQVDKTAGGPRILSGRSVEEINGILDGIMADCEA